MPRSIAIALLLCGCAAQLPTSKPVPPSDHDALLEAMARAFPKDANLYQLATFDDLQAPASKVARLERPAPQGASGPVVRTRVAFCGSDANGWRCLGPWDGVRVSLDSAVYSALAPAELEDSRVLALFGYVGSECSADQAQKLGVQWDRSRLRSMHADGARYVVQMAGPQGFHLLTLETVTDPRCAFEIRDASVLTELAP